MTLPRVLFVNHASRLAGAEMVLLDVAEGFPESAAFLFEDGPLRAALQLRGVSTAGPLGGSGFSGIKRDRSLWRALPHLAGLARTAWRLRRAARRFDLVYANSQKAFVLAAPASAAARRKLVWHLHDIMSPEHFGSGQIKLAVRLANAFAARVIVPSRAASDALIAAGAHAARVRVVPNGLDLPEAATQSGSRAAFGLGERFVFGVFSRLAPWKGQHVALRALAALPEAGCVIAGSALFGEDAYAELLARQAAEWGVADRVRFLGQRDDVPALMRAVDAVVHPSTEAEPFGRTLVEAMLARRPVIAANAGAVPEILDEGRAGLLFPPGDHEALAAQLRHVMDHPDQAMIAHAETRARTLYNAGRMRDGVRAVVREAMAGPS